jgi:hypothetical protein
VDGRPDRFARAGHRHQASTKTGDDLPFELFNLPIELLQMSSQVLDKLSEGCW